MASSSQSLPVSVLLKTKSQDGELQKKTREDWRKAKELEEARKAGTAPAAVDEEGRDINPHIPQYISAAPWYYNTEGPTLKHQRPQEKGTKIASMQEWFHRGVNLESVSLKFRKGACENCGAITHKRKDCMERPRKIGAKFSGESIAPDEFVQPKFELDFDSKRDRWNGYDPAEHAAIIEEFQKVEETKRAVKAQKLNTGEADGEVEDDEEEDEDKYVDEVDMPGTKVDSKQRITVRNLRIREDTAKYLRNLDPNSAYYDPKTRSMRDNPYKNTGKTDGDVDFAGENFIRYSGDTVKHAQAQLFAWEAHTVGVDVHLLAEPTKAEKLQKEYGHKKEEIKGKVQDSILEKYGGRKHLEAPPRSLLLAQTEDYVEYSRQGKVIKGAEKPVIRSQYEEDILINNHTTVWGSYWKDGHWGYQCCHSFIKNSYCTGDSGKSEAKPPPPLAVMPPKPSTSAAVNIESSGEGSTKEEVKEKEEKRKEKKDKKKKKKKSQKRKRRHSSSSSSSDSEDEQDEKIKKLKAALALEEKRTKEAEKLLAMDERKRPYNSMTEVQAPTEEEMEAYYLKRKREEDPMASFF